MKTFYLSGDPTHLHFENRHRCPANEELQEVLSILEKNNAVMSGRKKAADCDIYECVYQGIHFDVIYDANEGTSIYSENGLKEIECLFSDS